MAILFTVIILVFLVNGCWAVGDPLLENIESPLAFYQQGSLNDFNGTEHEQKLLFSRQECGQGYGVCGTGGDCCPPGPNCCGNICIEAYGAGSACCQTYVCPPQWKCCGNSGNHCAPVSGVCCTETGYFCPENWSCCGDEGYCYPTAGFHCCSNDGSFCPNGYACVYCNAGSTKICCQGTNGVNIPPYVTQVTGSSTPSIPATPSTQAAPTSHTAAAQTTSAPVYQYYTTTFTYSYIVWTDITYIENVVSSTITTTYTVLSCSATDDTAASTTLANLASQVEESASISAQNASPTAAVASQTSSLTSSLSVATAATGSKSEASTMIGRLCVSGTIAATAGVLIVILVI